MMMNARCASDELSFDDDDDSLVEQCDNDMDCGIFDSAPSTNLKSSSEKSNHTSEDRMTELVHLQKSNGIFELSSEKWAGSVFEEYSGTYADVQSRCPSGIPLESWLTALAINICEMKMSDKKVLWELVVQKSKKCLMHLHKDEHQMLLDKAKELIKNY